MPVRRNYASRYRRTKRDFKKLMKSQITPMSLNARIKKIAFGISETKNHDHYETDNVYSYAGTKVIDLFDPASDSAGSNQVVGDEAYLDKTRIKLKLGRGSGMANTTWRVILFYWHDVSDLTVGYDDLITEPPVVDNALFPLSNLNEEKKKRYTIISDMTFNVDSYESRIIKSIYIDHKKRKVFDQDETYNPRFFIMFLTNAPVATPGSLHIVARTTYKDI